MLEHSYRSDGTFKFRDILFRCPPACEEGENRVYAGAQNPGLDMDKVIYFAASIVWRSGAGPWRRDDRVIDIDLGKYKEPLRRFLLGADGFPAGTLLHTWVSSAEGPALAVCHQPEEHRFDGMRAIKFAVPGINFRWTVASHIPERYMAYGTAPADGQFVAVVPDLDREDHARMLRLLWNRAM